MTWDQSRQWCVERHEVHRIHTGSTPTMEELVAVRTAFPQFATVKPADLRAQLGGQLDLGERGAIEANALAAAAAQAGLTATIEKKTRLQYSIIDESGPSIWLIEDDDELLRTAREMIAAGVKVVDVVSG